MAQLVTRMMASRGSSIAGSAKKIETQLATDGSGEGGDEQTMADGGEPSDD